MEYRIIKAVNKPTSEPEVFTVYEIESEKYIFCPIRHKLFKVNSKPEEIVRQYWIYRLKEVYGYSFEQIAVEVSIRVGSTEAKKKADIVVYSDVSKKKEYLSKLKNQIEKMV